MKTKNEIENLKEEATEKLSEKLTKLTDDELDQVAGGFKCKNPNNGNC